MQIWDVIWLEEIEDKIWREHHVSPIEVEEALISRPYVRFMEREHRPGEDLYAAFGQTLGGRYLTVFFIFKPPHTALIVTARDMTRRERRTYGTRR